MIDEMFFVHEEVFHTLNAWLKQFSQEGPSKTVGENIAHLMLQFLTYSVRLSDVNTLPTETDTYLLEGLTKCSVEEFSRPFDMMIQKKRVKQLSSGVSIGGYSLSILPKMKSIVKLSNSSYDSLRTSGAFNVPAVSFSPCLNCVATYHGIHNCTCKRY